MVILKSTNRILNYISYIFDNCSLTPNEINPYIAALQRLPFRSR